MFLLDWRCFLRNFSRRRLSFVRSWLSFSSDSWRLCSWTLYRLCQSILQVFRIFILHIECQEDQGDQWLWTCLWVQDPLHDWRNDEYFGHGGYVFKSSSWQKRSWCFRRTGVKWIVYRHYFLCHLVDVIIYCSLLLRVQLCIFGRLSLWLGN